MALQAGGSAADGTEAPLLPSSVAPGTTMPAGGGAAPRRNRFAFVCATLASMTTMLHSYNLTLMSGAQLFIREDVGLSDAQVEVLTGSMNVFMLVSILAAGWVADRLGRRCVLVIATSFLMVGALAMSLGGSYATLMAARFVTGIGAGFARVVAPVYNTEISPPSTRGVLSSLLNIFINLGVLLSYVSNYAFSGLPVHLGWRVMYGVGVVPPVFIAAGILLMPESPRWLAMRGRHGDARAVLVRISDTSTEADLRLSEIKHAVAQQPEQHALGGSTHGGGSVWKELLLRPSASLRRILLCVLALQFFVPASGVEAILLYSPLVFKAAGMTSTAAALGVTIAIGAVKMCFILLGVLLTDRLGRRPLLLASTAGVAATTAALALTLAVGGASAAAQAVCVAAVLAVVAAYSVGYALVVNTYSAEILPLRLRAQGLGVGVAVNRLVSGLVTMTFISVADAITMPGCFFMYAVVTAVAFVFVYARLPETKGRSLEDMDVLFNK
ncbi:unnamed protein product [Urochloa decumbens]|uniref:Major facilitator superfamily (MFS) profile domain-containing protein n=2 Tax=Urochloa decumbens TaxID=240449 RepID=A0ABC9AYP4_9POAL